MKELWDEIIKILSGQINKTAIETWFTGCELISFTNNHLVISAENQFKEEILNIRFLPEIKKAAEKLLCSEIDVLVLSDSKELRQYKESESQRKYPAFSGREEYSFENFIVGESNRFVFNAAKHVAEHPGDESINPLFIYSGSGMGKTHLLYAIGQYVKQQFPEKNVIYVKANDFLNELLEAIQNRETKQFRNRYRYPDVLLIDDIYLIAGKVATQEEFFNTFNAVYESGHQIVLTSDRPPSEVANLEQRLRTRFEGGVIADIHKPNLQLRKEIICAKSRKLGIELTCNQVEYVADCLQENVRQLEGAIKNIAAYYSINGEITDETISRSVKSICSEAGSRINADMILQETARYYSVTLANMTGQSREKRYSAARQTAIYLMRTNLNMTCEEIGRLLGNRNHSTIVSSIKQTEKKLSADKQLSEAMKTILLNIHG